MVQQKGYGFLGRDDGEAEVFADDGSIQKEGSKSLKEGEAVLFNSVDGETDAEADRVIVFEAAADGKASV